VRTASFLLLITLVVQPAYPYTVILNSGKQVHGEYVGEDGLTLQLRDSATGILLSFKKDNLNLDAMAQANRSSVLPEPQTALPRSEPRKKRGVAEIARELRNGRTGKARLYTPESLSHTPEISFSESETADYESKPADPVDNRNENYWRGTARRFQERIAGLEEKRQSAMAKCSAARDKQKKLAMHPKKPSELSNPSEPPDCLKIKDLEKQIQEAHWEFERFQDQARKLDVPWSWID
jgi:hypothetical protein